MGAKWSPRIWWFRDRLGLRSARSRQPKMAPGFEQSRRLYPEPEYVPCFLQSYGWLSTTEAIYIAMEYLPHGDLKKHLIQSLPESEAKTVCTQVLEDLKCMHENGFVHRDLTPQNILVGDSSMMVQGTMGFMAREVLGYVPRGSSFYAVDIWSLGALLFFVSTNAVALEHRWLAVAREVNGQQHTPSYVDEEFARIRTWEIIAAVAPLANATAALSSMVGGRQLHLRPTSSTMSKSEAVDSQVNVEQPDSIGTPRSASAMTASQLHDQPASSPPLHPRAWPGLVYFGEPKSTGTRTISGWVASFSKDKTIKFWNLTRGQYHATVQRVKPFWKAIATAFSPGLSTLAVSLEERELSSFIGRKVKIRDPAVVTCLRTFNGETSLIARPIALSVDFGTLALEDDDVVRILEPATGQRQRIATTGWGPGGRLALSPDSSLLAAALLTLSRISVWELPSGRELLTVGTVRSSVTAVCFSPDSALLVFGSRDGIIQIWDLARKKCTKAQAPYHSRQFIRLSAQFELPGVRLRRSDHQSLGYMDGRVPVQFLTTS
ncbi:hypothetical protein N657DRAFT_631015 [Parathielavia appendiculata]|uniref:EKC/KEOPS complex subunit BUD32 n=1 Tax=Parathielavia appendiculata TaxID=2587402 RepID=A0AAN6Z6R8_9PEZI|nr:hypothetical protein N657DRAFT_631015 [Parathielavia appendiculata]